MNKNDIKDFFDRHADMWNSNLIHGLTCVALPFEEMKRVRIVGQDGAAAPIVVAGGFCSVDHNVVTVAADRVGSEITGTAEDIDMLTETVVDTDSEDLD